MRIKYLTAFVFIGISSIAFGNNGNVSSEKRNAELIADAELIDEIIYQVGNRTVLRSDMEKARIFLKAQSLTVKSDLQVTQSLIEDFIIDYVLQQELSDQFGIAVTDEQALESLQLVAKNNGQSLEQLRASINTIQNNAYQIFYEFHVQQLRFSQLHYAIARQNVIVGEHEVEMRFLALPERRISVLYVLLFADYIADEPVSQIDEAIKNKNSAFLADLEKQGKARVLHYQKERLDKLPTLVASNLPKQQSAISSFSDGSGKHWLLLEESFLPDGFNDEASLKEAIRQQIFTERFEPAVSAWLRKTKSNMHVEKIR